MEIEFSRIKGEYILQSVEHKLCNRKGKFTLKDNANFW